jgi:sugar phosphate isomerase/epimerase
MNHLLGISIHNVGIDYIVGKNFKRVQLCHKFSGAREITSLIKLSKKHPIKVSYHAPVFYQSDPTVTYYLNSNERLRRATFDILETNLRMAQSLPTDHVIVHFTSKDIDDKISDKELYRLAEESGYELNHLSKKYNIPIHLEYAGYNNRFNKFEDWIGVVNKYENLGICLDVGHLYLSCQLNNFDYFTGLYTLLPQVKSVHLWNTRGLDDIRKYGHIPVHPEQTPKDGWIDIEETLRIVLNYNGNIPIVFEPDFNYGGIEYAEEGIDWINELIYELTSDRQQFTMGSRG